MHSDDDEFWGGSEREVDAALENMASKRGKKGRAVNAPQKKEPRLSMEQDHAIDLCCDLDKRIVGVTGGAGTGKTLVLGMVHRALTSDRHSVVLCAPTGRAAKRISELTGIKAFTVHRLLEFPMPDDDDPNAVSGEPKRNKRNPLIQRVVIVDEASMVAPTLFRQLMDAIPNGGVIRFFGDNNQLPPVEAGIPPFIDVLERFDAVTLTYNYRSEDLIVSNAMRILNGSVPMRNAQFEVIYSLDPIAELTNFVNTKGKEFADADHQIIMPTRKGRAGTLRINPALQLAFNRGGKILQLDRYDEKEPLLSIKAKDKYVWIKNDYKLNIFNGDMGVVEWINTEDGSMGIVTSEGAITIPARLRTFSSWHGHMIDYDPRKQIELGYAITTHKSQGSEFDTIVYCMCAAQAFLLNRANFYTAVTRAKRRVFVITDRRGMGLSMRRPQR